ncbi:MAG: hypothetical protein PVS2B2_04210 [Candidatus Acidiferrum sp.]
MDEFGRDIADESSVMIPESVTNAELRKRRSTRIVQAVPLLVTGVDALGRPFTERTSTLIINCHGCRYQSKHYVLKNMWVNLEIPHPESGHAPRHVRGRVAWIQRPRTVRQLFQVALELEAPGNVWGIGFAPEDWFPLAEMGEEIAAGAIAGAAAHSTVPTGKNEMHVPLSEAELAAASGPGSDNLRVFPSPANATDAALQLSRHVTRLVAEAKQQIQAATREAAAQAVAAERRVAIEQWEQKFAAAQEVISRGTAESLERIHQETEEHARAAQNGAMEALRNDLPKQLAPQLEQLTSELTSQLEREGSARRAEHEQQVSQALEKLRVAFRESEEATARLQVQAEQAELRISGRIAEATHTLEEAAQQREEASGAQRESLNSAANQIQQQVSEALQSAQSAWHSHLATELESAETRWQIAVESGSRKVQEQSVQALLEKAQELTEQLRGEGHQQNSSLREASDEQAKKLEGILAQAIEASTKLEHYASRMETVQQQAVSGFQSQLDDVLSVHRNELHRRSDSLFEEINNRIRATFEEASGKAMAQFQEQIETTVGPHVLRAEEAVHRLAGGRSLLDAAMTLQQDRIRATADDAFAESLGRFRENLGSVEQVLHESSQTIIARNLEELESKTSDLKHKTIEDMYKSAEWYEKKAQTQLQQVSEKMSEQAGAQLREKAGEVSSLFASELSHTSQNFLEHTQTQMGEMVRDSFERARMLFAEVADTTSAAFTDEIQRTARMELDGFTGELQAAAGETRQQLTTAREELTRQVTTEQEEFLRRFQAGMSGAVESGIAEAQQQVQAGFGPLLDSWKAMTDVHQEEMRGAYGKMNDVATEQYRTRLENVSNSWMLAAAATLDHQSRSVIDTLAKTAEERLRETCSQVFAGIGDSLRERLQQIATSFTEVQKPPAS